MKEKSSEQDEPLGADQPLEGIWNGTVRALMDHTCLDSEDKNARFVLC